MVNFTTSYAGGAPHPHLGTIIQFEPKLIKVRKEPIITENYYSIANTSLERPININKIDELANSQFSPEKMLLSQYDNRTTMSEKLTLNNYTETIDLQTESENVNTLPNHFNHNLKRKHSLKVKYERERKEINTKISQTKLTQNKLKSFKPLFNPKYLILVVGI